MNSNQKQTYCLGGRQMSNTYYIVEYDKINPKTNKIVKIINGFGNISGRNKSQIFTK